MYYRQGHKLPALGLAPYESESFRPPPGYVSAPIESKYYDDVPPAVVVPKEATPQVATPPTQTISTISDAMREYVRRAPGMTLSQRIKFVARIKNLAATGQLIDKPARDVKPVAYTPAVERPIMSDDPESDDRILLIKKQTLVPPDMAQDDDTIGTVIPIAALAWLFL